MAAATQTLLAEVLTGTGGGRVWGQTDFKNKVETRVGVRPSVH